MSAISTMHCYVYRSRRLADTYVYLTRRDDFSPLPGELACSLGELDFALDFELTPQRRLARADPREVLGNLTERGFHLQKAPDTEAQMAAIAAAVARRSAGAD